MSPEAETTPALHSLCLAHAAECSSTWLLTMPCIVPPYSPKFILTTIDLGALSFCEFHLNVVYFSTEDASLHFLFTLVASTSRQFLIEGVDNHSKRKCMKDNE